MRDYRIESYPYSSMNFRNRKVFKHKNISSLGDNLMKKYFRLSEKSLNVNLLAVFFRSVPIKTLSPAYYLNKMVVNLRHCMFSG